MPIEQTRLSFEKVSSMPNARIHILPLESPGQHEGAQASSSTSERVKRHQTQLSIGDVWGQVCHSSTRTVSNTSTHEYTLM
jgi:hypothetical protein